MHKFGKETVFALYRVRRGKEAAFQRLLERHWPTLHRLGYTNGEPSLVFRGKDDAGGAVFTEIFTWKDAKVVREAHHHKDVAAIWEAMAPLTEERGGRRQWEFPHYAPVAMPFARGGKARTARARRTPARRAAKA